MARDIITTFVLFILENPISRRITYRMLLNEEGGGWAWFGVRVVIFCFNYVWLFSERFERLTLSRRG